MRKSLVLSALLVGLALVIAGCPEEGPPQSRVGPRKLPKDPLPLLEKAYEDLKAAVDADDVQKAKDAAVECRMLADACGRQAGKEMKGGGPGTGTMEGPAMAGERRAQMVEAGTRAGSLKAGFETLTIEMDDAGLSAEVKAVVLDIEEELSDLRVFFEDLGLTAKKGAAE